jgi:hypothetical protein
VFLLVLEEEEDLLEGLRDTRFGYLVKDRN